MSRHILRQGRSKLPFGRLRLLRTYYSLILKSFFRHRLTGTSPSPGRTTNLLDFNIAYSTFPVLINLYEEIFIEGSYYFETTASSPIIIDCGSNIGMSVIYFKCLYPDSKIAAFEPDAVSFSLLERNVHENALQNVVLINAALGDEVGEQLLYTPSQKNASLNPTLIPTDNPATSASVSVECLSFSITGPVDCLKIDVEGSELKVLEELIWSRKLDSVEWMVIEFHHEQVRMSLTDFVRMIEAEGMKVTVRKASGTETLLVCVKK